MTEHAAKPDDALEMHMDLARIALKNWSNIVGEPMLVMHRENTVFRVETAKGPAALRIHRAHYHAPGAIQSELDWMAHLAANGIRVPAPIAACDGRLLIGIDDLQGQGHIVDLLTWLDGAPLGKTGQPFAQPLSELRTVFQNLGIEMARLHLVSDEWNRPPDFARHAWDLDGLVGDNPFWGRFWDVSGLAQEEARLLIETRDQLRSDLGQFANSGGDYGLIHADMVRENLLISGVNVGLIDFDDAGFGFRMFDIATALFKNRAEPHYEALKSALLDGYTSQRPLSSLDLEALPLFTLLRALTYLGWGEARRHEPGMEARRARFNADALGLARAYLARC